MEAAEQLEVTPSTVNSAFCIRSNAFRILIYARQSSVSFVYLQFRVLWGPRHQKQNKPKGWGYFPAQAQGNE